MAVVSTSAAEMVAVSGIATYDIYKRYFNPHATSKQILYVNRCAILTYGVMMGVLGTIFYYIGIGMGYLYVLMGCIIGCGVCPVALAIMSTRANKWGCILGAWLGLASGLIAWLVTTATLYDGVLSIETTGANYPILAGNLASLGMGVIISVTATLIWPENCDFTEVQETIKNASGRKGPTYVEKTAAGGEEEGTTASGMQTPKEVGASAVKEEGAQEIVIAGTGETVQSIDRAFRFAAIFSITLAIILLIVIPLPMFFSSYVFTPGGFTGWVSVAFIWVFFGEILLVMFSNPCNFACIWGY